LKNLRCHPPPAARHLLVRLRRGQAICRLAKLARLLIRDRAGRQHRAKVLTRPQGRLFGGFRLSPNRRSLLFGLACSVLCVALSLLSQRVTCVLILHTHRSSRWPPAGKQIFENFCALRAQARNTRPRDETFWQLASRIPDPQHVVAWRLRSQTQWDKHAYAIAPPWHSSGERRTPIRRPEHSLDNKLS
jgi:hypothetical protein